MFEGFLMFIILADVNVGLAQLGRIVIK
ncbi:MAG: hypothetical protein ACJAYM_000646 [Flavobacteriales bacterium]